MSSSDEKGDVQEMQLFTLGELPDGYISLAMHYATSQAKLSKNEMESMVIAMSRDKARLLAKALADFASQPPSGQRQTRAN